MSWDDPVALGLRAIQKYDEVAPHAELPYRRLLVEAEDRLGEALGLRCTGEDEGGGFYNHGHAPGAYVTCPVHEWLVPDDQPAAEAEYGGVTRA